MKKERLLASAAIVFFAVLNLHRSYGAAASSLPPGYSISTLDLAGQTHRQILVDREPGQYLGHPTTVLLEDGKTILCVYPKGHGRGAIVMKRSTDGGLTWSQRLGVPANWATSLETPTIHLVIDKQGNKRLIIFSGLYPIRMSVSEDDGRTWSPLQPIGDFGGVVAMASVERLANNDYMALFHDDGRFLRNEGKSTRFVVYKTISGDGGLTWSPPEAIFSHSRAHLCEPGLVRSPDGRRMAILLRENSRQFNSFVSFSDNEGLTWSEPRELPAALTGDRHVAKYALDGRLFITFRDTTRQSPTQGDWVGWVGTWDDIVYGRQGQYRIRLMDNHHQWDCAYPGLERLPDGTFVTTTYGHWTQGEPPYIVSVRFKIEELDILAGRPFIAPVYTSGRAGYHTYRIPSLITTVKGTLLAFCEGRKGGRSDSGNIDLLVKRSGDGGITWSDQRIVWDDQDNTCGNPCPVIDSTTGTIHLLMTWNLGVDREPQIIQQTSRDTRRVFVSRSMDDGLNWIKPQEITETAKKPEWTWYATGPGIGIQLEHGSQKGRLVVPCDHIEAQSKMYYSHIIYSDDHGKTWILGGRTPADQVNECQVVELTDGTLMLNMRNYHRGPKSRAVSTSADGGLTWSKIAYDEQLPEPRCQASLISYQPKEQDPLILLFSNPAHTDQRVNMTVRASLDEGQTWPIAHTLHPGPAAYSCLASLPGGDITCFYEAGRENPYETIVFHRFTMDWLKGR
ncbi:MAG: exo-alpha-sialidase [Sedimentisphaerales bacterium]|nr:exo-alpha-sialidase [Sedimentisphaerales bacterium]